MGDCRNPYKEKVPVRTKVAAFIVAVETFGAGASSWQKLTTPPTNYLYMQENKQGTTHWAVQGPVGLYVIILHRFPFIVGYLLLVLNVGSET